MRRGQAGDFLEVDHRDLFWFGGLGGDIENVELAGKKRRSPDSAPVVGEPKMVRLVTFGTDIHEFQDRAVTFGIRIYIHHRHEVVVFLMGIDRPYVKDMFRMVEIFEKW